MRAIAAAALKIRNLHAPLCGPLHLHSPSCAIRSDGEKKLAQSAEMEYESQVNLPGLRPAIGLLEFHR